MILFYSDYLEGAHPAVIKKLEETNLVQTPGYGKDDYCENARSLIREICDTPDADVHFLVGGTQANMTVISSVLRPYEGVLCATNGHINVHETGAVEHSGHKVLALESHDGKVCVSDVDAALSAHNGEESPEHEVKPGMLYISFPSEMGTIYSKKELNDLKAVCLKWNIPLFIDGARLGYGLSAADCDVTLAELAAMADIMYIGGTKQGALFGEAVMIRSETYKKGFRYNIKQNGGMLAKGRLLGIQFSALLENGLYFELARHADILADRIREALREKDFGFLAESRTNQVLPILPDEAIGKLEKNFGIEIWQACGNGCHAVRICTSWATTDAQADAIIEAIREL